MIVFFPSGMRHEQHKMVVNSAKSLPSLFVIHDAVEFRQNVRIEKNPGRRSKTNPVFAQVGLSLGVIPFKA
ncbi:hypothetical protein AEYBE204_13360 [Asticcacaulis sp. YBE204]|nr:hypothetical protein AEYBE204_13360 [Asticcacaulis sp. YBE204]